MTDTYRFYEGKLPLLISFPHDGTLIPEKIATRMTAVGRLSADTDWHVHALYQCLDTIPASVIVANYSRYVIDLNRPADDAALYPGQSQTTLCPTSTFDGAPLYTDDNPDAREIRQRRRRYWQPYHERIRSELERLRATYGYALLWDAHSIRGVVPRLFDGRLPDFNFGSNDQRSADAAFCTELLHYCHTQLAHTAVANGRFKGGYITRHYGAPEHHVHALQLELNQQLYLRDETRIPPQLDPRKAQALSAVLGRLLDLVLHVGKALKPRGR